MLSDKYTLPASPESSHEQGDTEGLSYTSVGALGRIYPIGAETCSCTITHLPSSFSQITVQRKFPISTFPAFVVISSFTVAVPHARSPCWCMAASSLTVNFARL